MGEYLKRNYLREEEFLAEFPNVAYVAAEALDGEWQPAYHCDGATRKNRDYFRSTGELNQLVFMSAAVYHAAHGFSSAQILIESSKRVVNVRVRTVNGELVAEKVLDRSA